MPIERIEHLGEWGLNTDVSPDLLPNNAVTSALNAMTYDRAIGPSFGDRVLRLNLPIEPTYALGFVDENGIQWLMISDGTNCYACDPADASNDELITPTGGTWAGGFVSMCVLNGVFIINSETDGPHYWPGSGDILAQLPGPGDDGRAWLSGSGVPGGGLGSVGDFYFDIAGLDYYEKTAASTWTTPPPSGMEYGWNWSALTRCKYMTAFRYNLVAINIEDWLGVYQHLVKWSESAEDGAIPIEWTARNSNDAGDDITGETGGELVGACLSRDALHIIKEDALYAMTWIGGQYIYQISRLTGGVGTRIKRGFCDLRGSTVVANADDVLIFDGHTSKSMLDGRIRKYYSSLISEEYWERVQVYFHEGMSLLIIVVPSENSGGELLDAFLYNVEEGTWGHRRLYHSTCFVTGFVRFSSGIPQWDDFGAAPPPGTVPGWDVEADWDGQTNGSWNKGQYQSSAKDLMMMNSSEGIFGVMVVGRSPANIGGASVLTQIRRVGLPIGGAEGRAMITRVYPKVNGTLYEGAEAGAAELPLLMRFGGQKSPDGDIRWDKTVYKVWPDRTESIAPRITGRYLAWEVESYGVGDWRLSGLAIEWQPAGLR